MKLEVWRPTSTHPFTPDALALVLTEDETAEDTSMAVLNVGEVSVLEIFLGSPVLIDRSTGRISGIARTNACSDEPAKLPTLCIGATSCPTR
ncbi:hypothetical protein NMY22_g6466 [Coprinellus aureogranulatus]|nr:hypothetical protein NMY22_g6466 [Coprinellus aureogranulatus]